MRLQFSLAYAWDASGPGRRNLRSADRPGFVAASKFRSFIQKRSCVVSNLIKAFSNFKRCTPAAGGNIMARSALTHIALMSTTLDQYREAKNNYLKLRNQAKKELIARFNEL